MKPRIHPYGSLDITEIAQLLILYGNTYFDDNGRVQLERNILTFAEIGYNNSKGILRPYSIVFANNPMRVWFPTLKAALSNLAFICKYEEELDNEK